MIRHAMHRTVPALALIAGLAGGPAAADVIQAYPAVYELSHITDDDARVIASGDVLIQENRTVEVREGDDEEGPAIHLSFTAEQADETERRLAVNISAEIAYQEGERRISAGNDDNGNYISGPEVRRVTFETRRWQTMDEPEPLRILHEEDGDTYLLTLMFEQGAFR